MCVCIDSVRKTLKIMVIYETGSGGTMRGLRSNKGDMIIDKKVSECRIYTGELISAIFRYDKEML